MAKLHKLVTPMSEHAAQVTNVKYINKNFDAVRYVVNEHARRLTVLGVAYIIVYALTVWNDHDIRKVRKETKELKKRVDELENKKFEAEMEN